MTNEIDELIRRILDGNAPEEEVRMLMRWMKEDESHREYFNMLKKVWNDEWTEIVTGTEVCRNGTFCRVYASFIFEEEKTPGI